MPSPIATAGLILPAPEPSGAGVVHVATSLGVRLIDAAGVAWETTEPLVLGHVGYWYLELCSAGLDGAQRTIRARPASGLAAAVEVPAVRSVTPPRGDAAPGGRAS